ncbi:MAG: 6-phosphogluconolactonase [Anaerolineales bacterium]
MKLRVFANVALLAGAAADFLVQKARAAVHERGQFIIALSGGTSPAALYQRLAQPHYADQIDWEHVHVFWSDERAVPPEHTDSNFRTAWEILLQNVPIPPANVHRIKGELPPAEAAALANRDLAAVFAQAALPKFDLILLGLGDDGHTASLFPASQALNSDIPWVAANYIAKLAAWRLTFTLPLINAARQIVFLVSGESKAKTVKAVIEERSEALPASKVQPLLGDLHWFLDRAAAGELSQTLGD